MLKALKHQIAPFGYNFGFDRRNREHSISLKIKSKHRQVTSSKLSKSFRGARDLVVLGESFKSRNFTPENH